jgi:succinate dehydrogenase / fumarate reductase cytochrome b subunit
VSRVEWAYRGVVATVTTQPAQRRAPKTGRFSSSVVKKSVMAVSGIIMILYLIAHMIGNLHAFEGADSYNGYSHWLRTLGEPAVPESTVLWIIRLVLIVAVVAHFWAAISLWRQARRARPVAYVTKNRLVADFSNIPITLFYVLSMLILAWHIRHGVFAATQTLGQTNKKRERAVNGFAYFLSGLIGIGFVIVPLSIAFGLID